MRNTLVLILCLLCGLPNGFAADAPRNNPQPSSTSSNEGQLILENDSTLSWRASAGRAVSIKAPQLTLIIPGDNTRVPFNVKLRKHSAQKGEAVLEYGLSLSQGGRTITGSGTLKVTAIQISCSSPPIWAGPAMHWWPTARIRTAPCGKRIGGQACSPITGTVCGVAIGILCSMLSKTRLLPGNTACHRACLTAGKTTAAQTGCHRHYSTMS